MKINTEAWGEFAICELFDVVKGSRLTKAERLEGPIRYVGATMFNNGVYQHIGNREHVHPGNVLTVCYNGPVGTAFYQDEPFWATDDVNVLYPKFPLTRNRGLFIAPIIEKIGANYAYTNKWKLEDMKATIIKLPVTSEGSPYWEYMDSYIEQLIDGAERRISALCQVLGSDVPMMKID